MKKIIRLQNLDCANCAMLLERTVAKVDGVTSANVNFMALKLTLEYDENKDGVLENVEKSAKKVLPDCKLIIR